MIRIATALAILSSVSTSASAAPAYEGTFVTHCAGKTATCIFDVERKGKTFHVSWIAGDRTGRVRYCDFTASLIVATGPAIRRELGKALIGVVDGGGATVILTVKGDRAVLRTTGGECRTPGGVAEPDGIYDREVIDY